MRWLEVETKYRASDITLTDFIAAAKAMSPVSEKHVSSFDHYYTRSAAEEIFIRHRTGDRPELTMKEKRVDTNNFVRVECNLPLDASRVTKPIVDQFCSMLGFTPNFSVSKQCVIFFWPTFDIVYYVVYDEDFKEKDRFIEIEMSETHAWENDEAAWSELTRVEKALSGLGISPARRIRRSLFEMFRKT